MATMTLQDPESHLWGAATMLRGKIDSYEYLIAQFADDAGKKGGEFYTPKMVVRLIVECLQPEEGMSIYDPTCGSGGMLLECFHSLDMIPRVETPVSDEMPRWGIICAKGAFHPSMGFQPYVKGA